MTREVVNPEQLFDPSANNANHAVVENGTLYISGQVGLDENGELVGDDIESQARRSLENLVAILDAVDRELQDATKLTSYLTDIHRDYDAYKEVWAEYFDDEPYPAHTALGVDALAMEELLVEIEAEVPLEE